MCGLFISFEHDKSISGRAAKKAVNGNNSSKSVSRRRPGQPGNKFLACQTFHFVFFVTIISNNFKRKPFFQQKANLI